MVAILSVRQPFASAIVHTPGSKTIENRPRPVHLRGLIGIHASLKPHDTATPAVVEQIEQGIIPTGAVVGTVHLVGCHRAGETVCAAAGCYDNMWAQFRDERPIFHWELDHPTEFMTPIPAKGALGFWQPGPSVEYLIQIAEPVA